MVNYERIKLLNVDIDNMTMDDLVDNFDEGMFLTLHVDMIMKLQKQRDFYETLSHFKYITCDSQILLFAARLLGTPLKGRVSGSDFFPLFYKRHKDNPNITVFLCGGQPGIAEIAREKINAKVGREFIVGTYAPPFDFDKDPEEIDRMVEAINASGATALLVGLGAGRQEKFMVGNRNRMPGVKMYLPLGGTIDYEAETLKRPAPWVTNVGLEWLYRLLKEPRQRWHRYLVHQPPVMYLLLKQMLGAYKNPFDEGHQERVTSKQS